MSGLPGFAIKGRLPPIPMIRLRRADHGSAARTANS